MTSIALAPTPLRFLRRAALLVSILLAACASNVQAQGASARSVAAPARAEANGGNPRFYDVFGKRYYVLASSEGYRERGIASWYGHPFHGRQTSNGERYDMHEMTAAHKSLPLPTWVEVTNLTNGKRIVVRVNDRGPFVGKRVIDLSYAAANALDMVRAGTANVEVRALAAPPPATTTAGRGRDRSETRAPTQEPGTDAEPVAWTEAASTETSQPVTPLAVAARPPLTAEQERLFAQAGKFRRREDAVELVDTLKADGFVNAFIVTEDGRRRSTHRVRVGPLLDAEEVDDVRDRLRELDAKRLQRVVMR
ncbi:MAG TPA: septal ring lytic transglycosylase RlpA family protein [Gammaproteobacteria bacterium]|nr:septal ring lytic transglycosylase RlpA family protein [Gammaproteobacteria bacterium]